MVKGKPMTAAGFRFQLRQLKDQPEWNCCKLKRMQKSTVQEGLCSKDISLGQEKHQICVVNTFDNEELPQFRYITQTVYPPWYQKSQPKGCKCIGQCAEVETCYCTVKNGGQIPFNFDGAIVLEKPLIYECGPACGCPPLCYNQVSENGIKFPLEVFKTERQGWGGTFSFLNPFRKLCVRVYWGVAAGLEVEQRKNNEYLFDVGHNYDNFTSLEGLRSDDPDIEVGWASTD